MNIQNECNIFLVVPLRPCSCSDEEEEEEEEDEEEEEEPSLNYDFHPPPIPTHTFSACHGFELNLKTGEIGILLEKGKTEEENVMCVNDVIEVIGKEIQYGRVSRDERITGTNPFEEFTYSPLALMGTSFMRTMLGAEKWLSGLISGEVVSEDQGDILHKLPPYLQLKLKPILERLRSHNNPTEIKVNKALCFLIDVQNVHANICKPGNWIKYDFEGVDIRIKACLKTNGGLLTVDHPLATLLTQHFTEISNYFPVLSRLRELAKFVCAYQLLNYRVTNLQEQRLAEFKRQERAVLKWLINNREGWNPSHPILNEDRVRNEFQNTLRYNNLDGLREHLILVGEKERLNRLIRDQLRQQDKKRFDHCARHLCRQFNVVYNDVRPFIPSWLDKDPQALRTLADICSEGMRQEKCKIFDEPIKGLKEIGITPTSNGELDNEQESKLIIIPPDNDKNILPSKEMPRLGGCVGVKMTPTIKFGSWNVPTKKPAQPNLLSLSSKMIKDLMNSEETIYSEVETVKNPKIQIKVIEKILILQESNDMLDKNSTVWKSGINEKSAPSVEQNKSDSKPKKRKKSRFNFLYYLISKLI